MTHGYRRHVSPTEEEIDRLPAVLDMRPLWLASLEYREAVRVGRTPVLDDDGGHGFHRPQRSEHLAEQALAALAEPPSRSTEI